MFVDPGTVTPGAIYRLMISIIVPRPIAFVSTLGETGVPNLAPFSYFAPLASDPPLIAISINTRADGPKDTLRNIRASGEFVVNIVDEPLLDRMVQTSGEWPYETNEFELAGIATTPSDLVKAPGVAESPARLECRLEREVPLGDTTLVIGQIQRIHVRDEIVVDGLADALRLRPVGRLGGNGYTVVREVVRRDRPRVARPTT
jgi:flavin reductase (DIM6/NTAB) family NADH-FMN oxidoreductase RutF